ncbi:axin interactor, dorsalization-associated protein-like [Sycon ciliatum]|uniref:axin interactor, dorsalization-associated protein-like n=1 Tax=Sycon ciliatum TaxID=27933 RepID=UPI0020ACD36D|eukprot:scpid81058/ scgid26949/ Axin interactor, dorsalization-associated protein; Axin interaction partner and dorsalization antagonist
MAGRSSTAEGRHDLLVAWKKKFKEGCDFDNWGQAVEAGEIYALLKRNIEAEVLSSQHQFAHSDTVVLKNVCRIIASRYAYLGAPDLNDVGFGMTELTKLVEAFCSWTEGCDLPEASRIAQRLPSNGAESSRLGHSSAPHGEDDDDDEGYEAGQSDTYKLVQKPTFASGKTLLTIRLDRIGLKDAPQHIDPFFSVLVRDVTGTDRATPQRTSVAIGRSDLYLRFEMDIYIDIPLEEFPQDCAIFFELNHYKQKKGKHSTRCFAFLEHDEFKPGEKALELYKKPTNFKRRKLSLLTVKPLYLHLDLQLTKF